MSDDYKFYKQNIINATNILSDLMVDEIDQSILNDENLDKIDMNLKDGALKIYKDKVISAFRYFKQYREGTYTNSSEHVMRLISALGKFLIDPNKYLQPINYTKINPMDKTNQQLKSEVVNLALSYIDKDVSEFKSNEHHREIVKAAKGRLVY